MGGIVGLLAPLAPEASDLPVLVRRMARTLRHRGPDSEGFLDYPGVSVGMTHLGIIDPNTGDPPIANEDGSIWAVIDGEIYNYSERRAHLVSAGHEFRTQTDTEVILHEYEERGLACVEQLRGALSLALWDANKRQLLLARDHFGIKPLYLATRDGSFAFASEMKALFQVPWVDRSWDATALSAYLRLGYTPALSTAYRGIRKLSPGTVELWAWDSLEGARRIDSREYWAPRGEQMIPKPTFADAALKVHELLRESVRLRLRNDVRLGAFLSGGIDSSAIVATMRQEGVDDLLTFSIGFEEDAFNELPYADLVAKHFGASHHSRLVTAADALALPRLLEQFDEPFADSSAIPTFFASRLARDHVPVVLTGDGGDELFAGYSQYRRLMAYHHPVLAFPPVARMARTLGVRIIPEGRRGGDFVRRLGTDPTHWHLDVMGRPMPQLCRDALSVGFEEFLSARAEPNALEQLFSSDGTVQAALLKDQRTYLVDDGSTKVDRMSMAASLATRMPFLDHVLADYVNALPLSYKLTLRRSKRVLRVTQRDMLPKPVLQRPKEGFGTPLRSWLCGPLHEWSRQVLLESCPAVFDEKGVCRLLSMLDKSALDLSPYLWTLLALGVWSRVQPSALG